MLLLGGYSDIDASSADARYRLETHGLEDEESNSPAYAALYDTTTGIWGAETCSSDWFVLREPQKETCREVVRIELGDVTRWPWKMWVSADGKRFAVEVRQADGGWYVWRHDLDTGQTDRFESPGYVVAVSDDLLTFATEETGIGQLGSDRWMSWGLPDAETDWWLTAAFEPQGKYLFLAVSQHGSTEPTKVFRYSLADGSRVEIAEFPRFVHRLEISPDGSVLVGSKVCNHSKEPDCAFAFITSTSGGPVIEISLPSDTERVSYAPPIAIKSGRAVPSP